nr:uncharacterized protein LOC127319680 [Lolium perenne]
MTRSKLRVVQSNDEYMTEEHENTMHVDAESSASEPLSCNGKEGFPESDDEEDEDDHDDTADNAEEENGETNKRGKTKLKKTWNLPKGQRIVVKCNDLNQPIGKEAGRLGYFLGTVARNGKLCSLSYTDWRKLIGERDKKNEQNNKKDILGQVKMRFLYPPRLEKYILKTIGERWRQHKSNLKALFFDATKSMEANNTNVPKGVIKDQWISLVTNWMSQKAQDISEKNRQNSTMKKSIHTAGTKSFARNREELRQKDPEKKNPHRAVLYIHTHQHKIDKNDQMINEHVVELKKTLAKRPDLADTSKGTAWKGDALNTILGVDKRGHVHGLGLVPNPNQVFGVSSSGHFQDIHLTSVEDTHNEDVMYLRLQMEKIEQHMKNQDAKILELTEKS